MVIVTKPSQTADVDLCTKYFVSILLLVVIKYVNWTSELRLNQHTELRLMEWNEMKDY